MLRLEQEQDFDCDIEFTCGSLFELMENDLNYFWEESWDVDDDRELSTERWLALLCRLTLASDSDSLFVLSVLSLGFSEELVMWGCWYVRSSFLQSIGVLVPKSWISEFFGYN